jgi:hypothetical protein
VLSKDHEQKVETNCMLPSDLLGSLKMWLGEQEACSKTHHGVSNHTLHSLLNACQEKYVG